MSFWDHFDVLRRVVIRIAAVVIIAAVLLFLFMPQIFDAVVVAPCRGSFPLYKLFDAISGSDSSSFGIDLINVNLASQLFVHLSLSFHLALVISFPIVIYFIWTFIRPALYQRERRGVVIAFNFGLLMFYIGVAVGYFVVFPLTLRFLATYQLSSLIPNVITIDSYMENFLSIIFIMGILFEMPVLGWLLGRIGLLKRSFFTKYRRHAVVLLLVLAAIITPTGDPFTLAIVMLPLYLLYELTAKVVPSDDFALHIESTSVKKV